ncbi:MAG: hypothetical protein M3P39_12010 [Actinomycetota bacterium]|nr:hypothetical protein [Actinomycetota bacterium]
MRPVRSLLLVVGSASLIAGCGQGDDREQLRAVTQRFSTALAEREGAVACAQLSEDLVRQLESQEGEPCPQAVLGLALSGGQPAATEAFITSGKVELTGGKSVFLDRTSEGWRLSALGCQPEQGKPADRPFECEVEA